MTKFIKAPFNFVPLNKKVVCSDYYNEVSHDIPFEDSHSGYIDVVITGQTPVFVRNGTGRNDKDSNMINFFSHVEEGGAKNYFIPATSLKGMFRSVFEIMTMGYIRIDKRMKFAVRDMQNTSIYPLRLAKEQSNIRCGWLEISEKGNSKITDCGKPYRINHLRLDEFFKANGINVSFENCFSHHKGDLTKEIKINNRFYDPKNAAFKYALLGNHAEKLNSVSFKEDDKYSRPINDGISSWKRLMVINDKIDSAEELIKGTIVFTGQPDKWQRPENGKRDLRAGKFYEFVFPDECKREFTVSKNDIDQFSFIYAESQAWQYFRKQGRIPVFFRVLKKDGVEHIRDFGLALLYKLPYNQTAHEVAQNSQGFIDFDKIVDMADAVFGAIKQDTVNSLKGRVQFGHAFAEKGEVFEEPICKRMGSPKASYLPFYIDQSQFGKNGVTSKYKTYNDVDSILSGWKRYPVHDGANLCPPDGQFNEKLDTKFLPLKDGSVFKGRINFFNLQSFELGALLSALSFHGNEKKLCHSLGMAKSYGFGKIKVEILLRGCQKTVEDYLVDFEEKINSVLGFKSGEWLKENNIVELFSMAWDRKPLKDGLLLEYMQMDNNQNNNQFQKAKSAMEYLERFTELTKEKYVANSLFEDIMRKRKDEARLNEELKDKLELEKIKQEEERRKKEEEKRKQEGREKKKELGLTVLLKHNDWNRAKKEIEQYMRLNSIENLGEEDLNIVFGFLNRMINGLKDRDKKEWLLPIEKSSNWKKLKNWMPLEKIEMWRNNILNAK